MGNSPFLSVEDTLEVQASNESGNDLIGEVNKAPEFFNEMRYTDGSIRPTYKEVVEWIESQSADKVVAHQS